MVISYSFWLVSFFFFCADEKHIFCCLSLSFVISVTIFILSIMRLFIFCFCLYDYFFSSSECGYLDVQLSVSLQVVLLVPSQCLGKQALVAIIRLPQNHLEVQILLVLRQGVRSLAAHLLVSLGSLLHLPLVLHQLQLLGVPCLPLGHHQLLLSAALPLPSVVSISGTKIVSKLQPSLSHWLLTVWCIGSLLNFMFLVNWINLTYNFSKWVFFWCSNLVSIWFWVSKVQSKLSWE